MQTYFNTINKISPTHGLFLNKSKTVLMRQYAVCTRPIFYPGGSEIKEVKTDEDGIPHSTIYLGTHISSDSKSSTDIKARLSKVSLKYKQLQSVWNSQLSFQQKLTVFQAIFLPLITYAIPQAVFIKVGSAQTRLMVH